jgi:hypothetical protein
MLVLAAVGLAVSAILAALAARADENVGVPIS